MIACLRGILLQKSAESLVVDVGGVGYEVFFPNACHPRLPEMGGEIFLHVQAVVREDAFSLYGFLESGEKEMFQLLNTVSGVGPKLAHNILAGLAPKDLARAINLDEIARLTRLPGVGKKTAERLCLELKDKVRFLPETMAASGPAPLKGAGDGPVQDAISALLNLGYPAARVREAMDAVRRQTGDESFAALRLEELIRQSLRALT